MASTACIPPVPAPGDAVGLRERARGALLGLAVGDALGAPAENMKPSEIRARWGRITGYVARKPAGTDDTEYAIFSGLLLARYGSALTPAHVETAWHEWIADREEGPFRGAGFSERGTLENLRRGLAAPISAQHRHAWSDGLAMRAAPYGVFAAGRPAEAARLVAIDGSVSHEGEGIYGGQAVAAGVAAAMAGAPTVAVVASALAVVPDDSWTARCLRRAMTAAHRGERAVRSAVVIGGYPWTDLAPEAVALAFGAYAAADGDFTDAVLTAVNMGRDADTTAAVAGALAGATQGAAAIPAEWASAIGPARGSCLPAMAGHHVLEVADLLTQGAEEAQRGTEAAQRGAEKAQRGTEKAQRGTEKRQRGTEKRQRGTEKAQRGTEAAQRGTEAGTRGTEPATRSGGTGVPSAGPATRSAETKAPSTKSATRSADTQTPSTKPATRSADTQTPSTKPATRSADTQTPSTKPATRSADTQTPSTKPATRSADTQTPSTKPATRTDRGAPTGVAP
ncbi:ADP-ribosylglycohydrolase family protein [Streptomyces sp. BB1-1-1]|uniref:ADP-ribosylglycohydrolase family protein n=1 Tax=Streptomyces sp. BB1-1-1 TaxID=3074430 RepID=UPI0028774B80|nr:ADP-ribosylglycohydrolase family protein [Streptomyces sp. BB1-1-1]WND38109.1 ADP-ribosylglycohydrolase family protein [Streptomyces sp. BB1-1-1]